MSHLIFEHLAGSELPAKWARYLPTGETFTVSIVPENTYPQPTTLKVHRNKKVYAYLRQWKNFFDPS